MSANIFVDSSETIDFGDESVYYDEPDISIPKIVVTEIEIPAETLEILKAISHYETFWFDDIFYDHEPYSMLSYKGLGALPNVLIKKEGRQQVLRVSALGLEDADLDNLAVLGDRIYPISGSGTRLATEWWVKHDGYDLITISVGTSNYAFMFYDNNWHVRPCSTFLYEGAELDGHLLWLRENTDIEFSIRGYALDVVQTPKQNFGRYLPCQDIVMMIDHRMYRLKKEHTLDLLCDGMHATTSDGMILYKTDRKGIYEYTLSGKIVRERTDKQVPDSTWKHDLLRKKKNVMDLIDMLNAVPEGLNSRYIPDQHIAGTIEEGVDMRCFSYNILKQMYHPSTRRDDLDDCISKDRKHLDFPKFVKGLKARQVSFVTADLRKSLIRSGYTPYYAHWRRGNVTRFTLETRPPMCDEFVNPDVMTRGMCFDKINDKHYSDSYILQVDTDLIIKSREDNVSVATLFSRTYRNLKGGHTLLRQKLIIQMFLDNKNGGQYSVSDASAKLLLDMFVYDWENKMKAIEAGGIEYHSDLYSVRRGLPDNVIAGNKVINFFGKKRWVYSNKGGHHELCYVEKWDSVSDQLK